MTFNLTTLTIIYLIVALSISIKRHYAEGQYAECIVAFSYCYAESHYAGGRGATKTVKLQPVNIPITIFSCFT
jgi:hypothetical protein